MGWQESKYKKFNWGAFFLGWLWGIGNKSWITLLQIPFIIIAFLPVIPSKLQLIPILALGIAIIMAIIFGIYGNKWAIQNNSYITEEDFTKHQQKFIKISAFLYGISCLGLFTNIIYTSYLDIEAYLTPLDSTPVFQYLDMAQIGICFLNMIVAICISFIWSINAKKIIKIILYVCLFFGAIYFAIKPFSTIIAGHNYLVNPTPKNQLVYYKKVLIDDPKNEYYIQKIREAYCKLGDIDGAIKHLEAHQNDIVKEFDELINLYIIKGDYEKVNKYDYYRYKLLFLQEDWEKIPDTILDGVKTAAKLKTTNKINKKETYLTLAIAYKNLGDNNMVKAIIETCPLNSKDKEEIKEICEQDGNYMLKLYQKRCRELGIEFKQTYKIK